MGNKILIKITHMPSFGLGLMATTFSIWLYIMNNGLFQLQGIFLISMSFLTLNGILENKKGIVSILMGIVALSLFLIMTMTQKIELNSLKDYLFILFPIALIIVGILTQLGYLSGTPDELNLNS